MPEAGTIALPLRANRPLLALFFSQFLGMVARGVYYVGLPLFVLERTGSPFSMSVSLFLSFAPFTLAAPFVGPVVDRFSRRDLLVASNLLYGSFILILPFLRAPYPVFAVAFCASMCGVLVSNCIVALLPELVEISQLARANSAYMFLRSATFLLSTGSAYFLVKALGKANVFFLCSALLGACSAASLLVKRDEGKRRPGVRGYGEASPIRGMARAVSIIRSDRHVRGLTVMHLLFMPVFGAFEVLLPLFSAQRLGEVNYYTLLSAAVGAGLALGSLFAYRILERVRPLSLVLVSFCGYAAGVFLLSRSASLWASLLICLSMGVVDALGFTTYEFLRQRLIPSEFRGRVFATMDALVLLPLPLGYLGMGYLAGRVSIVSAALWLSLAGLVLAFFSFPFTRNLPSLEREG
ncbi:MFS transporter [Candidatus Solincola tengchongensis]|uniref:MFS transporter n=1 Tax=Candidatus Solincola tengchongensis TaxID=2900693 RepID=UPI00257B8C84|nr:MFS transporter [Candidatus Solincola tengchongensis]